MIETVDDYPDDMKSSDILFQQLHKSEEDIEAGRIIDYSDFIEKLRSIYNI